jgi:hypothetical protein
MSERDNQDLLWRIGGGYAVFHSHDGQAEKNRFGDKSAFMTVLRLLGTLLLADYARTFFYLNFIYRPRQLAHSLLNNFYRIDHVYSVINEFKNTYRGPFSILEFGVADGYAFSKLLYATRYQKMDDEIVVHGFDSFEGLPKSDDRRDKASVVGGDWKPKQFTGDYNDLKAYCSMHYRNWRLHKGYFDATLSTDLLEEFHVYKPMLVWIDCDYYTSARTVMERLIAYLPSGCVVYFDEYEFNFGSRFTGEARLVHEINNGMFGEGVELVLDRRLSFDLNRCYRFINLNATTQFERLRELAQEGEVRRRGNDSPLP